MKYNYVIAAVMVLSLVQLFGIAYAQEDALSLANVGAYPQPIIAGNNVTIAFQLYNSYTNELTNVNLELQGSYPLLSYSPYGTQLITGIPIGLYGGTYLFTYTLHIPQNVKSGTYSLDVVATYQTQTSSGITTTSSSIMPLSLYIRGTPSLRLTASSPSGIAPGAQSSVNIDALNVGTDNATNVTIAIQNSNNFSAVSTSVFNLGTIGPQQTGVASALIITNSTLKQGTANLPVIVSYSTDYGKNYSYNASIPVTISLGTPVISIGVESASPATLYAGSNQTITLSVQNTGSGTAKNVTISTVGNKNITAGNSASNLYVGTIAAGQSTTAKLFITANKNDNKTQYNLPINVTYQNANYNLKFNKTLNVPISLQSSAEFNITGEGASLEPGQTYVPITLKVKNTGNSAAQSITFSLETIYPISQVNPNAYLSSLAPGQTANVTFYVNVDSSANNGQYPLTLYEQWTQPNGASGQQYSASQTYSATVGGTGGLGSLGTIAIIVVVVIAGVLIYRFRIKPARAAAAKKEKK